MLETIIFLLWSNWALNNKFSTILHCTVGKLKKCRISTKYKVESIRQIYKSIMSRGKKVAMKNTSLPIGIPPYPSFWHPILAALCRSMLESKFKNPSAGNVRHLWKLAPSSLPEKNKYARRAVFAHSVFYSVHGICRRGEFWQERSPRATDDGIAVSVGVQKRVRAVLSPALSLSLISAVCVLWRFYEKSERHTRVVRSFFTIFFNSRKLKKKKNSLCSFEIRIK